MHIVVIGTRGIPNILGGVETHCEQLYPRIVAKGHRVTVIRRSSYVTPENRQSEYRGVELVDVYAPRKKSVEALVHTFLAVIKARRLKADVLQIHAIGPALMTPFARLLGMKVVMTNHGPDYDRQKWGRLAKTMLKTGERLGTRWSNRVIVISNVIADILRTRYGRSDTDLIYNGVDKPVKSTRTDYIESLGLQPGKYIVAVGRFVKEKGFHDLIEAFEKIKTKGICLAIAGDADHPDDYSESLKRQAENAGVTLTGFIRGEKLNQLMTNAALYVIPSYHEGLPFSLLEAMSYGLDSIVSDIPANRLDCLTDNDFFHAGDTDGLAALIDKKLTDPIKNRHYDLSPYDWDRIADQTIAVYESVITKNKLIRKTSECLLPR